MDTLKQAFVKARARLEKAGIPNAAFDAAKIIEKHTGFGRGEIVMYGSRPFTGISADFWKDVERRVHREPLQYICGTWPFFGLDFFVGKGVLIPRPDTEIICETAIPFLKTEKAPAILELCAGSGCISVSVLKHVRDCKAVCVEISDDAAFYLKKNIQYHGLENRIKVIKGDMLSESGIPGLSGKFDALLCNPPYIESGGISSLEPEVSEYEPRLALDGGRDGLKFYRAAEKYFHFLSAGGMAVFEVGAGESSDVSGIFKAGGLEDIFIKKDYSGINRVVGGFAL